MKQSFYVENIKCSGCMTHIEKSLRALSGMKDISIVKDEQIVTVTGDFDSAQVIALLNSLGYPLTGKGNFLTKAKSYVSCALGRLS